MEKALNQAEVDALLKTLTPADPMEEVFPQAPRVRKYDFRRPGKFVKDQLRTLAMIHENLGRWLGGFFVTRLRSRVQVSVRGVCQYAYSELVQSLANPTVLAAFTMAPLPGTCVMELSPNIGFALVERVFGGPAGDEQPRRPLSDVETAVVHRFLQDVLQGVAEVWHSVAQVNPRLVSVESNPLFLQVAAPGEVLAVVTLSLRLRDHVGHLLLGLPYTTVEPVLARLSPDAWFTRPRPLDQAATTALRQQVQDAVVEMTARLGSTQLTLGQFLALRPGDVMLLDQRVGAESPLYVSNQPVFLGQPGLTPQGRLAIEIRRRARP